MSDNCWYRTFEKGTHLWDRILGLGGAFRGFCSRARERYTTFLPPSGASRVRLGHGCLRVILPPGESHFWQVILHSKGWIGGSSSRRECGARSLGAAPGARSEASCRRSAGEPSQAVSFWKVSWTFTASRKIARQSCSRSTAPRSFSVLPIAVGSIRGVIDQCRFHGIKHRHHLLPGPCGHRNLGTQSRPGHARNRNLNILHSLRRRPCGLSGRPRSESLDPQ